VDDNQKQIEEIEANQTALRESIEKSRQLCDKSDQLIAKHKQSLQNNESSSASGSPWD
jgi:hypothetical protein